jgi:hypothetical protein
MNSLEVRESLIDTVKLDLVGPETGERYATESLPHTPSRWYLTGFLAPIGAKAEDRSDQSSFDDLESGGGTVGIDDDSAPEKPAVKRSLFASSIGVSCILPASEKTLEVEISWGDYRPQKDGQVLDLKIQGDKLSQEDTPLNDNTPDTSETIGKVIWVRSPKKETLSISLDKDMSETEIPKSLGLQLVVSKRASVIPNTNSVSIFVVNRREPYEGDFYRDTAFAFQVHICLTSKTGFISRPDLKGLQTDDPDELVADLQYRHTQEFAVGHGIATFAHCEQNRCLKIETNWMPTSEVEKVDVREDVGARLSMEELSKAPDSKTIQSWLRPLVVQYGDWIKEQYKEVPTDHANRKSTATKLLHDAEQAAQRISAGIDRLADAKVFEAFRISNQVMATAARQRNAVIQGKKPDEVSAPSWRPFQLAFVLLNLVSIDDPKDTHRNKFVDLLFFPTGGGKTEAYLGLSAFTLILRRLKDPSKFSAGLTVLMRYTLRLLTLDQLGRAATLICALELERQKDKTKLGEWPFEIGLWVGRGATPNRMGSKGDGDPNNARIKTIRYQSDSKKGAPIPLEDCPWCGHKLGSNSFKLRPNPDRPTDLEISCLNRDCSFTGANPLPVVAIDEPLYRRLPCFMIATVDKFASLPWTGEVGGLFGKVDRHDNSGFYNSALTNQGAPIPRGCLLPPDLIIQDELHLISGPMGTMVGLYEGAIDELCSRIIDGVKVSPKIIASTATVRRAERQIQALFNRRQTQIFPPPGPNVRDSFFAITKTTEEANARLYLGVAAQGRSLKVTLLRTYLALLSAAQKLYQTGDKNAVDPYMTLLGYFNSLRELGGSRRIVEDEIKTRLVGYTRRKRIGEAEGPFVNRDIRHEPIELTSRVPTHEVSEAKRQLSLPFTSKERVDVALATNMISVGLDISRLGLMVVLGQPKTTAEYIQTTSRVGRDVKKPGLVVTLFNIHKHRDRSHYERFYHYHQTFYRSVEVTSVTPFSPRALDKGLPAAVVALARHGLPAMTAPKGASNVLTQFDQLKFVVDTLSDRAAHYITRPPEESERIRQDLKRRIEDLMDKWKRIAHELKGQNAQLQYNASEAGNATPLLHQFLDAELENLSKEYRSFRASRSMRDVEATVELSICRLGSTSEIEEET